MAKKFTLISNNISYGLLPIAGMEIEQRLTLNSKGQIWFSGYNFKNSFDFSTNCGRKIRKTISPESAKELLTRISEYFDCNEPLFVYDCGKYTLTLVGDDGTDNIIHGSLLYQDKTLFELCEKIKTVIGIDGMFLFDGE